MRLAPGTVIGILGGGQLGRMMALAAAPLGLKVAIYDPAPDSPAFEVSSKHICAPWDDEAALLAFSKLCDVITLEFENVPVATVTFLAKRKPVMPGARALEIAQDRLSEKLFVQSLGYAVAPFEPVASLTDLIAAFQKLGPDAILKTRRMGYDGKGQIRLRAGSDLSAAWDEIGQVPCVLEGFVGFSAETSLILVRGQDGSSLAWDCPQNFHADGILRRSVLPGPLTPQGQAKAEEIGAAIAQALGYVGVLTIEYFVTLDGGLIINEIAPRVHNSGHWTIEAAHSSQFTNHIRAVAGWTLAPTVRRFVAVEMVNLIGDDVLELPDLIEESGCWPHLYGKEEVRPGRKMGHVTRIIHRVTT